MKPVSKGSWHSMHPLPSIQYLSLSDRRPRGTACPTRGERDQHGSGPAPPPDTSVGPCLHGVEGLVGGDTECPTDGLRVLHKAEPRAEGLTGTQPPPCLLLATSLLSRLRGSIVVSSRLPQATFPREGSATKSRALSPAGASQYFPRERHTRDSYLWRQQCQGVRARGQRQRRARERGSGCRHLAAHRAGLQLPGSLPTGGAQSPVFGLQPKGGSHMAHVDTVGTSCLLAFCTDSRSRSLTSATCP